VGKESVPWPTNTESWQTDLKAAAQRQFATGLVTPVHSPLNIDGLPRRAARSRKRQSEVTALCNNDVVRRFWVPAMSGSSISLRPIRYPRFGVLFCAWTTLGLLAFARYFLLTGSPKQHLLAELLGWLSCYYSWLLLTPLMFHLERRFPLGRNWVNVLVLAILGFPISYCAYEITLFLNAGIQLILRTSVILPSRWWLFPWRELGLELALYGSTLLSACGIRNVLHLREKERLASQLAIEKAELESSLRRAELETLRMRLNPHFLFNCLQSISTLSQKDPKTAGQMVTRLGDLLRVAVKHQAEAESTLEAEMKIAEAYIAIEQMRFGDRLSVLRDLQPGTENALVPAFLLQPLVENAIKHGLRAKRSAGLVWIKSYREASQLVVTVSDNGAGLSNSRLTELEMGVGLGSTCECLQRMYGQEHSFSMHSLSEGGTEVRIALPFKKSDSSQKATHEKIAVADR
jgi:two-component system, LytTR family, sensor kinase